MAHPQVGEMADIPRDMDGRADRENRLHFRTIPVLLSLRTDQDQRCAVNEELPVVITMTREEAQRQRADLLAQCRLSYEELRDRAAVHQLSMGELMIWHTIQGIDYLLGEEE